MCRFASDGRCKFGQACRFAHSSEEPNLANAGENQYPTAAVQISDGSQSESSIAFFTPGASGSSFARQSSGGSFATRLSEVEEASVLPSGAEWDVQSLESGSDEAQEELDLESDSDDSTKASDVDSWSVSTPAGSQSGEEDSGHRRRRSQRNHSPTTLLLKNVPEFLTQGALVSQFEDLSPCMRGSFDFFYLPWNPCKDCNLGYAIINFFDPVLAAAFKREWNNTDMTAGFGHEKRLQIQPAILQGYEANFRHFSSFFLAHHENLRFRPLLRASRANPLQAMPVAPEQVERFKNMLADMAPGLVLLQNR